MNNAMTINTRPDEPSSVPIPKLGFGLLLIALTGLIHLIDAQEYWNEVHYIGVLFVVTAVGTAVAAYGIARGQRWGWQLGLVIAVSNAVGYVLSRTVGIPQFRENSWSTFLEPMGLASLAVEIFFTALAVHVLVNTSQNFQDEV